MALNPMKTNNESIDKYKNRYQLYELSVIGKQILINDGIGKSHLSVSKSLRNI